MEPVAVVGATLIACVLVLERARVINALRLIGQYGILQLLCALALVALIAIPALPVYGFALLTMATVPYLAVRLGNVIADAWRRKAR